MTRTLAISAQPGEMRAATLEDGELVDFTVQRDDAPAYADNIYLGRVAGLDNSLEAAFVEIGLARPGFLPLAEAPKGLGAGDRVVVRVKRESSPDSWETKGARLTASLGDRAGEWGEAAARAGPPCLLHDAGGIPAMLLAAPKLPDEILIDDEASFLRLKRELASRPELLGLANLSDRLSLDLGPAPLFERLDLDDAIEALLEPRFDLPSGGFLLFEPVRTLTAIDVNAGRHGTGGAGGQALALNLEAAAAIPAQVRLRNLSGLLVVDFLTLREPAARRRVAEVLKQGFRKDPNPVRIQDMRPSGLLEMTRRRARPPLHEILTRPCGHASSGRVKSAETLAFEALREIRAQASRRPLGKVLIHCAPAVAAAIDGACAPARAALEARLGRPLGIAADTGQETFEIVLG